MNIQRLNTTLQLLRNEEIVDFDLSPVVIDGQPLFEMGEVPRNKMPQLKGFPRKGSVAACLPKDKHGKVNVSDQFINHATDVLDISVERSASRAGELSGSQRELLASKIARHVPKLLNNPDNKKFTQTYLVDRHGILLDGHHGWASVRVWELLTGSDCALNVVVFDASIQELIEHARHFTSAIGIENKEGV